MSLPEGWSGPPATVIKDDAESHRETRVLVKALNLSTVNKLHEAIKSDSSVDLRPYLLRARLEYDDEYPAEQPARPPKRPNSEPRDLSEITRVVFAEGDVSILWPLDPAIVDLLRLFQCSDVNPLHDIQQARVIRSHLLNLLTKSTILHQLYSKSVLRVAPDIVVKISRKNDVTELANLQHIRACSQKLPVPMPLGMILINKTSFAFTTFIPGIALDRIWADLETPQKENIRLQLDTIFTELRALPTPSRNGHLGGGSPLACKDTRRWTRTSLGIIEDEAQFNDFLLTEAHAPIGRVEFARACLRDDHPIMMTHGHLNARNILVNNKFDVKITGIVDWEYGG